LFCSRAEARRPSGDSICPSTTVGSISFVTTAGVDDEELSIRWEKYYVMDVIDDCSYRC